MSEEQTDTLKGIKLTAKGKVPIKESEHVSVGERADSLGDPARASIIHILRRGINDKVTEEHYDKEAGTRTIIEKQVKRNALSVTEIVRLSKIKTPEIQPLTKSQVYHHLPLLVDFGYVIKYGTVTKGKRVTEYYRRTAQIFYFDATPGLTKKQREESVSTDIDEIIEHFGFEVSSSERKELIQLGIKLSDFEGKSYATLLTRATGDIASKHMQKLASELQAIYHVGSTEWVQLRKRMYEILFKKK